MLYLQPKMSKIPKIYKYGIELTKPWSNEMYEFNESVSQTMISNIKALIESIETEERAQQIADIINPYTYGNGYDLSKMKQDMLNNTEMFENWWLNEIWPQLIDKNIIDPILDKLNQDLRIIGFEDSKEIKILREIYGPLNISK